MSFKRSTQPAPDFPHGSRPAPGIPLLPQNTPLQQTPPIAAQWLASPGNTIRGRYSYEGRTLIHPEGAVDSESNSSKRGKGNLCVEVFVG